MSEMVTDTGRDTHTEAPPALHRVFIEFYPDDAARVTESLDPAEILNLLQGLGPEQAARLLTHMSIVWAAPALAALPEVDRGGVLARLPLTHAARMLAVLPAVEREALLTMLPTATAREIELYLSFPVDSVGGLMNPAPFSLPGDVTVVDAVRAIRTRAPRTIHEVYVTNRAHQLIGTASLRDLLLAAPEDPLSSVMDDEPRAIQPMESRETIIELFEGSGLLAIPVTNLDGELLGEVRAEQIVQATQEDATGDMLKMVGVSGDERVHSSVWFSVRKRLPWLQINLVTAFLAAAVVGLFEDTVARFTALAVLLPVVAGQSGNTGAQSLAVVMRGLALRDARPSQWPKIAVKETLAGVINGLAVSATACLGVYLWSGNLGLTAVMGMSMILAMAAAGFAGASIPIVLKLLNQDPAQSSSIVLTTVTDVVGFSVFLGLATQFALWLE